MYVVISVHVIYASIYYLDVSDDYYLAMYDCMATYSYIFQADELLVKKIFKKNAYIELQSNTSDVHDTQDLAKVAI